MYFSNLCSSLWYSVIVCGFTFLLTVIMGFEHAAYSISEGNGSVEVCVQVKSGALQSPLNLSLTSVDGDAICEQFYVYIPTCSHCGEAFDVLISFVGC